MTRPESAFASARVAAGALFLDAAGRIMLVRPTYKDHWDIPGGYVEPGENPSAACTREVKEELGITIAVGQPLVIDWAPLASEGDKLLFVFDGGKLSPEQHNAIRLAPDELAEYRYVPLHQVNSLVPSRLTRRLTAAISAREQDCPAYLEHGHRL